MTRDAEWAIDVGAGHGELTLDFARLPPIARVYAIEPLPNDLLRNLLCSPENKKVTVVSKFSGAITVEMCTSLDSLWDPTLGRVFNKERRGRGRGRRTIRLPRHFNGENRRLSCGDALSRI
jgi:hypothetical protein